MSEYYDHGTFPTPNTKISSAGMRAELDNIEAGFNKLPTLAGNQNKVVRVKADASGLEAVPAADVNVVTSVAGKTGAVVLAKADVGLGNVDNTSDADKPVSTATQTALNSKSNTGHGHAISDVSGLQTALDGKLGTGAIGTTVQAFDADTAKTDVAQNFTAPQRSGLLPDNDGSFDLSAKQNFSCTTGGAVTLTFTNQADGLSGFVVFQNTANHVVSAHANTKISAAALARLSATGLYRIDYGSNGTNALCTVSENLA